MADTLRSVCPHDCPSQCALLVTWRTAKHQPGGRGVNAITDDRESDLGGGAVFHSNLIEVTRLDS